MPHRRGMSLLSGYDCGSHERGGKFFIAWVIPSINDLFYDTRLNGIPPLVAVEFMAQTVATFVGLTDRRKGKTPRIGFFLGTRRLTIQIDRFEVGRLYRITISALFTDDTFASFQAEITDDAGGACASAILSVFRPGAAQLATLSGEFQEVRPLNLQRSEGSL